MYIVNLETQTQEIKMDDKMVLQYHYVSPLGIGNAAASMAQWLRENPGAHDNEIADKLHELTGKPVGVIARLTDEGRIARKSVKVIKRPVPSKMTVLYRVG